MRTLNFALDSLKLDCHAGGGIPGGVDLVIGDDPIWDGEGRVRLDCFTEHGLSGREILAVALSSQLDEPTLVRRMLGFCCHYLPLGRLDGHRRLSGLGARAAQGLVGSLFPGVDRTLQGGKFGGNLLLLSDTGRERGPCGHQCRIYPRREGRQRGIPRRDGGVQRQP